MTDSTRRDLLLVRSTGGAAVSDLADVNEALAEVGTRGLIEAAG